MRFTIAVFVVCLLPLASGGFTNLPLAVPSITTTITTINKPVTSNPVTSNPAPATATPTTTTQPAPTTTSGATFSTTACPDPQAALDKHNQLRSLLGVALPSAATGAT
ncbi:hypothetical protein N2152v2_002454 [Parachlorella kessleri]